MKIVETCWLDNSCSFHLDQLVLKGEHLALAIL